MKLKDFKTFNEKKWWPDPIIDDAPRDADCIGDVITDFRIKWKNPGEYRESYIKHWIPLEFINYYPSSDKYFKNCDYKYKDIAFTPSEVILLSKMDIHVGEEEGEKNDLGRITNVTYKEWREFIMALLKVGW